MKTDKKILYFSNVSEITTFEVGDPDENPWVFGQPKIENIKVEAYDFAWATLFQTLRNGIDSNGLHANCAREKSIQRSLNPMAC